MKIKQYAIGAGKPLICVPVTETGQEAIIEKANDAVRQGAQALEWRIDWFEKAGQWQQIEQILKMLAEICDKVILLCTFRSKAQGGRQEITEDRYKELLLHIAQSGLADLLDVEVSELSDASGVIKGLHDAGQTIIGSQHYFSHTPNVLQMQQELLGIKEAGADIGKLAVMPKCPMDVLWLLEATAEVRQQEPDYLIVTMAMGGLGAISRISGQTFGSCITFASLGKASAPGQLPIEDTALMLAKISDSMGKSNER